jgi:CPA1 family monovalent cation:H+ antiporter
MKYYDGQIEQPGNSNIAGKEFQQIYLQVLEHQRKLLDQMNHRAEFDEELIRKYQTLIDLDEFKLHQKLNEE